MKKGVPRFLLALVLALGFIFLLPGAYANFACGKVVNNQNGQLDWLTIKVHYVGQPEYSASCLVSPEDDKYCCDPNSINQVSWDIGKTLVARVNQQGFSSRPVETVISGEGYDLFPDLSVLRIFKQNLTNMTLVGSEVALSAGFEDQDYALSFFNDAGENVINEDLSEGHYRAVASYESEFDSFEKEFFVSFLDDIEIERDFVCERDCSDGFVYYGSEIKILLRVKADEPIYGEFEEVVPDGWLFSSEMKGKYSESHDSLFIELNGERDFELEYSLIAPKNFFTRKYEVFGELNGEKVGVQDLHVYRHYRSLPLRQKLALKKSYEREVLYPILSEAKPAVLEMGEPFELFALYPKSWEEDSELFISYGDSGIGSFEIQSSLHDSEIDKGFLRFRVPSEELVNRRPRISYKGNFDSEFRDLEIDKTWSEGEFAYYEVFSEGEGEYELGLEFREGTSLIRRVLTYVGI